VAIESFYVSSVLNAIPATANAVNSLLISDGAVTQSKLGTGVVGNGPAFSVYRSGTQSVSSGVFTKVQFNVKDWDTANCFDATTNYRFTPNVAGYYQISASVAWGFTSNVSLPGLYKNGSIWKYGNLQPATGSGCTGNLTALVYLNGSTDYIELFVYQNNGTNNLATNSAETYFQGFLARAA